MKKSVYLVLLLLPFLASCQKQSEPRQYTEVITTSKPENTDPHAGLDMSESNDPHAFMKNMNEGGDPHAGFSKEQLQEMLAQQGAFSTESEKGPISWTVPSGWEEKPVNGMRLASLVNKKEPAAIDCSIVTLGASAGGLAPNVVRWMQQIQIDPPNESELTQFIDKQERIKLNGDLTAIVFDFSTLQKDSSLPSMIAAIIDTPGQRIFVKMTGTKEKVLENVKPYKALVQSVKIN